MSSLHTHSAPCGDLQNEYAEPPRVSLDPFDEELLENPYDQLAALRDVGPLFLLERYNVFGIARHREVSAALKDHVSFSSGRGVGLVDFEGEPPWRPPSLLLETDPPLHSDMRHMMNGVVSLKALKAVRTTWRDRAETLVDELVRRRRFDAVKDLAETYPLQVFPDTIGITGQGREHLLPYGAAVFNAYGPRNVVFEATEAALPAAADWVAHACKRENLTATGWGMDVFRAADSGGCSQEEAERLVRSFLSAGVDTTVNGIGNMMFAFTQFPEQWQLMRSDSRLCKRAFEEALRWDSTVQIFFRTTACDVEVADHLIPRGRKVLLFLAAANRDPRRWSNPDKFDIARQASGHVGFGFGVHQCLGQMVARLEAELILEALVARVASLRAVGPVVRRLNNSLHAIASLPVEIEPA